MMEIEEHEAGELKYVSSKLVKARDGWRTVLETPDGQTAAFLNQSVHWSPELAVGLLPNGGGTQ